MQNNNNRSYKIAALLASLIISSCATVEFPEDENAACFVVVDLPANGEYCAGSMDVQYKYINGNTIGFGNPVHIDKTQYYLGFYEPQESKNGCFAAALKSALASQGYQREQDDFINAIGKSCVGSKGDPASFTQIIYSATRAVSANDTGVWYVSTPNVGISQYLKDIASIKMQSIVDKNMGIPKFLPDMPLLYLRAHICQDGLGSYSLSGVKIGGQSIQLSFHGNLYSPITWTRTNGDRKNRGGIFPVRDTGDLVYHFRTGAPILVGLKEGHVVIVTELWYHPDNVIFTDKGSQHNIHTGPSTRIVKLKVMDPETPDAPIHGYDGNDFFSHVSFMFAIYGG